MKTKLTITGGVLTIISGGLSLIAMLFWKQVADAVDVKLPIMQYLIPLACIVIGVRCIAKKELKKSDLISYAIALLGVCIVQIIFQSYMSIGIIQIVLLVIASILFLFDAKNL